MINTKQTDNTKNSIKISCNIPKDLYEKIMKETSNHSITKSEVVVAALTNYFSEEQRQGTHYNYSNQRLIALEHCVKMNEELESFLKQPAEYKASNLREEMRKLWLSLQ